MILTVRRSGNNSNEHHPQAGCETLRELRLPEGPHPDAAAGAAGVQGPGPGQGVRPLRLCVPVQALSSYPHSPVRCHKPHGFCPIDSSGSHLQAFPKGGLAEPGFWRDSPAVLAFPGAGCQQPLHKEEGSMGATLIARLEYA